MFFLFLHKPSIPVTVSICPNFPESEPELVPCLAVDPDFGSSFIPENEFPTISHQTFLGWRCHRH